MPTDPIPARVQWCEHPAWTEYPYPIVTAVKDWPRLDFRPRTAPNIKTIRICKHCDKELQ